MPDLHKRIPMDPRVVEKIQRSPSMMAEQGSGFLQNPWGGPSGYQYWAGQPEGKRVTYFAVVGGGATTSEISNMTGLTEPEVDKWLTQLGKEDLITVEESA